MASSYMDEVPGDEEFYQKLLDMQVSSTSQAWREFFSQLNEQMGTGETKIQRNGRVHLEHILPQKPRATSLQESGLLPGEAEQLVGNLGNLTLLSGKRNRELSNKPFSEKRFLYEGSEILMTREVAMEERWTREEILERARRLADLALKAYPHPREIARPA